MNKEIKEKWIAALRSDEYKQGRGYLRKNEEFCAMGVLCDVVSPESWEQIGLGYYVEPGYYRMQLRTMSAPESVVSAAELHSADAQIIEQMNDDNKLSFENIADWIERRL